MADERSTGPTPAPGPGPRPGPRPERQIAFRTGISAESRAAAFLIAKGFRILARRWRSPVGEIDIIARRRTLLIFVEVKARANLDDKRADATFVPKPASTEEVVASVERLLGPRDHAPDLSK